MYSSKSYELSKEEYNYLIPVLRSKLLYSNDRYYFIGSSDDLSDMLDRLKGWYDYYDELRGVVSYKCFIENSLNYFRNELNVLS
jgi:hypothetical protein